MAYEEINVGTTANDRTGDKLRDAFIKVNNNSNQFDADILALKKGVDTTFDTVTLMEATNGTDEFLAGNTCINAENSTKYTYIGSGATGYWGNPVVVGSDELALNDRIVYERSGTETTEFTQATDTDTLTSPSVSPVYIFTTVITNAGATRTNVNELKVNFVTGTFISTVAIDITSALNGLIFSTTSSFGNGENSIKFPQTTFTTGDIWTIRVYRATSFQMKGNSTGNLIWYELISSDNFTNTLGIDESVTYLTTPAVDFSTLLSPADGTVYLGRDSNNSDRLTLKKYDGTTYGTDVDLESAGTDEKIKVSANDTTAGYLNGKLVAGTNVTLTENNDGGNETLSITANLTGWNTYTGAYTRDTPNQITITGVDVSSWEGGSIIATLSGTPTKHYVKTAAFSTNTVLTVTGFPLPATIDTLEYDNGDKTFSLPYKLVSSALEEATDGSTTYQQSKDYNRNKEAYFRSKGHITGVFAQTDGTLGANSGGADVNIYINAASLLTSPIEVADDSTVDCGVTIGTYANSVIKRGDLPRIFGNATGNSYAGDHIIYVIITRD